MENRSTSIKQIPMKIRNRMSDVVKLRTNACQDMLKMIILPGWQQSLYEIAKTAIESGSHWQNSFITVYNKMRDQKNGIDSFSVDDMDVSLICAIVSYWNRREYTGQVYALLKAESLRALKELKENRNVTRHSNENEGEDELYLRALLSLVNLRRFVYTIDEIETNIPDNIRLQYRQKYINKIKDLMALIDDERIELIQSYKEFDRNIDRIKSSKNPEKEWEKVTYYYEMRAEANLQDSKDAEKSNLFYIRASDSGIVYAHFPVAIHYILIKRNLREGLRRLKMILNAYSKLPFDSALSIVYCINTALQNGYILTAEMRKVIEDVKNQGFDIKRIGNKFEIISEEEK